MALAQRRHLDRVVRNECGLDQIGLAVLAEYGVDELALAHRLVDLDIETHAGLAQLLLALTRNVVARLLAYGVGHGHAAERSLERYGAAVDHDIGRAVDRRGDPLQHLLGKLLHPDIVLVGDVYLHAGKFGVVRAVHALVAEVLAELVYAVEAADDKSFEV